MVAALVLETREGASSRGGDLASLSTDAASNAAAANALIDAAVQKVAADKGIAVAMPSAGGAAGGAVVDSAALDAFAAKVTGADGVLASTAKFVLNQLGVAAPVAEETADENAAVVAAVEAELGADWPKQVEPRFDERKAILFDDRWASAREDLARAYYNNDESALNGSFIGLGKTIADDRGWHVGQKVKATAENIVVDKEATAKAQADYQAKVQAHVQELQSQAQQLAASGDSAGAQAKASEIEQYTNDAKNVDPKTLVKTKKVTTGKTLTIGAIVSNSVYRDFAIVNDDLAEQIGNKQTMFVMQAFVTDKRGADTAQVKKALKKTIKKYYTIVVFDRDEYKSTMSSMIDQMLMVLYALLALSIIIAIFGIVNTLALSVSERTKEIGLLRAIGTSRGQVRGMLGIEAAIISVFGTVLGLVVGVAAGVVIRAVYASEGLETLAIPWLQLLVFLLLSIVVGLVSSISPASRALKQPVLDAVASE